MTEVPPITPVTIPVVPIVATDGTLLLQVPPTTGFIAASAVVLPAHTLAVPVIGPGPALTVIVVVVVRPDAE